MKYMNLKEKMYYAIRIVCWWLAYFPTKVGNWATDKLNGSYYPTSNN